MGSPSVKDCISVAIQCVIGIWMGAGLAGYTIHESMGMWRGMWSPRFWSDFFASFQGVGSGLGAIFRILVLSGFSLMALTLALTGAWIALICILRLFNAMIGKADP